MDNTGNSRDFTPRPVSSFAELMTAEDWKQANSSGFLLPGSDGIGYWVRDNYEIEHVTRPCPPGVTHVAWYDK